MKNTQNIILEQCLWTFPMPIHYGPGKIEQLSNIAKSFGISRPLIVSDSETSKLGFIKQIIKNLKDDNLNSFLFSEFSPNPTDIECLLGCDIFNNKSCDGVIAIGGGSSLDAGKAIALSAYREPNTFWAFDMNNDQASEIDFDNFIPLICVPTTAGTGAEVEPGAIITNTNTHEKLVLFHPLYSPKAAILDPELVLSLPKNLTAWTGIDAIVHAIEAYSVPSFHPICDGIALQALSLMAPAIRLSYRNGDDLTARGAMLTGSCMAAISFTKGLGLVHSISHMVGGLYNTPHGLTNAIVLPAVLKYNRPKLNNKIKQIAIACGAKSHDFKGLMDWIYELYTEFNIPHSLGEIGVKTQDVDRLVEMILKDICLPTNPRPISKSCLKSFLLEAINKTW
jgi:alcohol dehydrogenase class IV